MTDPHGGDSAGQAWAGRALPTTGFDTDDGAADARLAARLSSVGQNPLGDGRAEVALVAAVAAARLLVPVVAEPVIVEPVIVGPADVGPADDDPADGDPADGDPADGEAAGAAPARRADKLRADKQVDMAVVTLVAPTGERALPVFTGLAALARWDPQARPVPVTAARAAQAAISEGCDVLVLDLGGDLADGRGVVLRASMVWALAFERAWLPAHEDPFVDASVAAAVRTEPDITAYALSAGGPGGVLRVALTMVPGRLPHDVRAVVTRVGERLATDGEFRARVDELSFAIVPDTP